MQIERDTTEVIVSDDVAELLGVAPNSGVRHTVTRVTVGDQPVAISDTYEPSESASSRAQGDVRTLHEALAIQPPTYTHGAFLGTAPGEMVVTIRQQFRAREHTYMVSDVTYPIDRYASYVFRMRLPAEADNEHEA